MTFTNLYNSIRKYIYRNNRVYKPVKICYYIFLKKKKKKICIIFEHYLFMKHTLNVGLKLIDLLKNTNVNIFLIA